MRGGLAGSWSKKRSAAARARTSGPIRENVTKPMAILVEYRDGTRGAVVNLIEATSEFAFAAKIRGRKRAD